MQRYVQLNQSQLLAIEEVEEACELVSAATNLAIAEVRTNVGTEPAAFESCFATADGSQGRNGAPPDTIEWCQFRAWPAAREVLPEALNGQAPSILSK